MPEEPWEFIKDSPDDGTLIDAKGNNLLHGDIVGAGFIELHAGKRAAACVNACAKIANSTLEIVIKNGGFKEILSKATSVKRCRICNSTDITDEGRCWVCGASQ